MTTNKISISGRRRSAGAAPAAVWVMALVGAACSELQPAQCIIDEDCGGGLVCQGLQCVAGERSGDDASTVRPDQGVTDAAELGADAGPLDADAAVPDADIDAGDAGLGVDLDTGVADGPIVTPSPDGGAPDAGLVDAGVADMGVPVDVVVACARLGAQCLSGCFGNHPNAICNGTLSGNFDNVEVPDGARCQLSNALVTGNLIIRDDTEVTTSGNVFVCGNLEVDEDAVLTLSSTKVCGNLSAVDVRRATLGPDLEVNQHLGVFDSRDVELSAVLACTNAEFINNRTVQVISPSFVRQGCSAARNDNVDFTGLSVLGGNSGCQ